MTRGRYQVTRLTEEGAPPRLGPCPCPCSQPVRLLLVLLLVLLVLAAITATTLVLYQQAQHRNSIFTADGAKLYRGGAGITEGDMLGLNTSSGERSGRLDDRRLWPLGRVPYRADPDIGCPRSARCAELRRAMAEYSSRSCVRWSETRDRGQPALQISYRPDSGCYAHVGYRGNEERLMVLGNGCFNRGILLHLLGHTLGLWHEHNRPDRDDWLHINMSNVDPGHADSFRKFSPSQDHIVDRLDYSSVMMFGPGAFSGGRGPTIRPHYSGRGPLLELWQKTGLSEQDVHRVQAMYIKQCTRRDRPPEPE